MMVLLPDDLTGFTDIRLEIMFGRILAGIKREIAANPRLNRLCEQSDRIEAAAETIND